MIINFNSFDIIEIIPIRLKRLSAFNLLLDQMLMLMLVLVVGRVILAQIDIKIFVLAKVFVLI
jgi:hypothetical protein